MNSLSIAATLARVPAYRLYGRVTTVQGMLVEIGGVQHALSIGSRCVITARDGRKVPCEAVGFRNNRVLLMPFGSLEGVGLGCRAEISETDSVVYPDRSWLGRVVDGRKGDNPAHGASLFHR